MADNREPRKTRETLEADPGVLGVLHDCRRRVRAGSMKAAHRMDGAIAAVAAMIKERDAGKFRSTNRDMVLSDPRPLAERLPSYARQFGNETIFAKTIAALLLEAHAATVERDALVIERDALREALNAILHTYDDGGIPLGKAFRMANAAIAIGEARDG